MRHSPPLLKLPGSTRPGEAKGHQSEVIEKDKWGFSLLRYLDLIQSFQGTRLSKQKAGGQTGID